MRNRIKTVPRAILGAVGLALASATFVACAFFGYLVFDYFNPPPLDILEKKSVEVVDRNGELLRAYTTNEGRWRLQADLTKVDKEFIKILIAYEDKRFYDHSGIDPLAVVRAAWQLVRNGRVISGASTLTMQLARLIEPRENRNLSAKLLQMVRAIQLEQRLTKDEILTAYLTLAPYGGNLEGVRAASLAYFAKEPGELSLSEAALLVALPQSPVARRPDIFPVRALKARNKVLERMASGGTIAASEVRRASSRLVSDKRFDLPQHAAHAADRFLKKEKSTLVHHTTLDVAIQSQLEQIVRTAAERLGPDLSVALVMADGKSGEILAEIGSPDYLSAERTGWVDMSHALRSPGSALKPFIYGLAFEEGLVRAQTLITDRPINFSGYRPKNFDMDYQGEVTVKDALLLSLNVPAVALLDAVGPMRLMERLRNGGAQTELPDGEETGLAIGLGGLGISLRDLVQLYTGFVNDGKTARLFDQLERNSVMQETTAPMLDPVSTWHIADILKYARPPEGAPDLPIGYKTGTSYGYRDAWSVGFDGRHVIGVWVGKPDNSAVPGITGRTAAAPILFEAFAKVGVEFSPLPDRPLGANIQAFADLPPTLRHFEVEDIWGTETSLPEPAPRINYPPKGAQIELTRTSDGALLPVMLKLQDGRPPFRWLANGEVFEANGNRRRISWLPDGFGQSTLTVIDAAGRADSVSVFLKTP